MALKAKLIKSVTDAVVSGSRKITVIGTGFVGMAVASILVEQGVTNELCLVDVDDKRIQGEVKDLWSGSPLLNNAKFAACKDYACTKESALCIITAGARQKKGGNRLDLLQDNICIVGHIVNNVLKHSPCTTLLMLTNPVDVLCYAVWRQTDLPLNRIVGSGTTLDSCRFSAFIAERLCVSSAAVNAVVIGEHGNSSVPCWSGVTVGNTRFNKIHPEFGKETDPEKWFELTQKVRKAAMELIHLKGATYWAIAYCTSFLASCILDNTLTVTPVTTNAKGLYGICDDVFFSLPCVLGLNGVQSIVNQVLAEDELKALEQSAEILRKAQKKTGL